jgi:hypothetical protein
MSGMRNLLGGESLSVSVEDYHQLRELMVRYAYAVDSGGHDPEEFFAQDAKISGPYMGSFDGMDAIREWSERNNAIRGDIKMRHYMTNFLFDVDGNEACIRVFAILVYRKRVLGSVWLDRWTSGEYQCTARKLSEGWRLTSRVVELDES